MSDDDLIQAAREGSAHAGPFLVSTFGPRMLGYCHSIADDLSDPDREHIVEIAVERAVTKIDRFDPARGRFEAWLRTFVLHATQDWRRDHLRLVQLDAQNKAGMSLLNMLEERPAATSEDVTSSRLTSALDALREHLPTLSVPDQVVLHFRDMEDRSVEETAELLGITAAACRQRHHRAKARLKRLLQNDPRCHAVLPGEHA